MTRLDEATERLELAIERLEQAVTERSAEAEQLRAALKDMQQENASLRDVAETLSSRLDLAIGRLKTVLET